MPYQVKMPAVNPDGLSTIAGSIGGMKELTTKSRPLFSTGMPWHTCMHMHMGKHT